MGKWDTIGVVTIDSSFQVVSIVDPKKAICMLYKGIVSVVNNKYEQFDFEMWSKKSVTILEKQPKLSCRVVRSQNYYIVIPECVRILKYKSYRKYDKVKYSKRNLFIRDNFSCQYCQKTIDQNAYLTVDHVVPECLGGKTSWENTVCCCSRCNSKKGGKLLSDTDMKLLKIPVEPKPSMKYYSDKLTKYINDFSSIFNNYEL